MISSILDRLAYRYLVRLAEYTPQFHYGLRSQLQLQSPELVQFSWCRFPFWYVVAHQRVAAVYWYAHDWVASIGVSKTF